MLPSPESFSSRASLRPCRSLFCDEFGHAYIRVYPLGQLVSLAGSVVILVFTVGWLVAWFAGTVSYLPGLGLAWSVVRYDT